MATAFLWDSTRPRPTSVASHHDFGSWWHQYFSGIASKASITASALAELTKSCHDIAALIPTVVATPDAAPLCGVVVGAVQSGKTQSMMGVAAVAMDLGYKLIIVLAGLKDDLRTQTARRFNTELLCQSDRIPGLPNASTLGGAPGARGSLAAYAPPYFVDCHDYAPLATGLESALRKGHPCVIVIKKNPASLNDLRMVLRDICAQIESSHIPTLILDDECDEASVPQGTAEAAIPEGIAALWQVANPAPLIAYIGYTATSAANLLQQQESPLYPNWVYLLRYASNSETGLTFLEPASDGWYSGSRTYFQDFGESPGEGLNFLVVDSISDSDLRSGASDNRSLDDALRAFFVGGAFRLCLDPSKNFDDLQNLPDPHSMMIHTSAAQDDHSLWAGGLRKKFGGLLAKDGWSFSCATLLDFVSSEEDEWRGWYYRFLASQNRIHEERPHPQPYRFITWDQVKKKLPDVFVNTRMKVVNSDQGSASLNFNAARDESGKPVEKPDLYTIAIGGSRLSRGITVEGLCISYFARASTIRYDDVVLQMSRWFGYRGRHLEFCRVFTTPDGAESLKEVAENDEHLRVQLHRLMSENKSPKEARFIFLANPYSQPTAKVGTGLRHDLTFSPYVRFLPTIDCNIGAAHNEEVALKLVAEIFSHSGFEVHRTTGAVRGYLSRKWHVNQIIAFLEELRFSDHNPSSNQNLMSQHYRQPELGRQLGLRILPDRDPYQIAAYLKFWKSEHARIGNCPVPAFNVGIALGERDADTQPFKFSLVTRRIGERGEALGGWTGRSATWRGDTKFDSPPPELVAEDATRLPGADGLLLLYVIHKDCAIGAEHHLPVVGISIPAGGPAFVRFTSDGGSSEN